MYPGNSSYNHGQEVFKDSIPLRLLRVEDLIVDLLVYAIRLHRCHVVACKVSNLNQRVLGHRDLTICGKWMLKAV